MVTLNPPHQLRKLNLKLKVKWNEIIARDAHLKSTIGYEINPFWYKNLQQILYTKSKAWTISKKGLNTVKRGFLCTLSQWHLF